MVILSEVGVFLVMHVKKPTLKSTADRKVFNLIAHTLLISTYPTDLLTSSASEPLDNVAFQKPLPDYFYFLIESVHLL